MKRLVISISDANAAAISNLVNSKKYENLNVAVDSLLAIALANGQSVTEPEQPKAEDTPAEPIKDVEPTEPEEPIEDEPATVADTSADGTIAGIVSGAIKSAATKREVTRYKIEDGKGAVCTYSEKAIFAIVTVEKNSPADKAILAAYGLKHQSTLPVVNADGNERVWYGYCIPTKKGKTLADVSQYIKTVCGLIEVAEWPDQTPYRKPKATKGTTLAAHAAPLSTKAEANDDDNDAPTATMTAEPAKPALPMSVEKPIHMPIKTPSFVGVLCTCTPKQHKPKTVEGIEFFMLPRTPEDGSQGSYYYRQGGKCYMASYIGANGDKLYFLNWGECVPTTDKPVDCGGDFAHRDELIAIASIGLATAYVQGKVKSVQEWQIVAHETANNVNAGYLRKHCAA